jgi:hypothetical protein
MASIAFALSTSDDQTLPEGDILLALNEYLYGRYG